MKIKSRAALLVVLGGFCFTSSTNAGETPIPRLWLQDIQQQAYDRNCPLVGVLRSQPLISDDERWEVYSRVTYAITPIGLGRLSSVLFARNRQTQQLLTIYSPASIFREKDDLGLDFLFLLPIEWRNGRVLVREFSGLFRSQAIRNQAVVWSPAGASSPAQLEIRTPPPHISGNGPTRVGPRPRLRPHSICSERLFRGTGGDWIWGKGFTTDAGYFPP